MIYEIPNDVPFIRSPREPRATQRDMKSNFGPTTIRRRRWNRRDSEQFIANGGGHIHDVVDRILIKTETPMNLLKRFHGGALARGSVATAIQLLKNYDHSEWQINSDSLASRQRQEITLV